MIMEKNIMPGTMTKHQGNLEDFKEKIQDISKQYYEDNKERLQKMH